MFLSLKVFLDTSHISRADSECIRQFLELDGMRSLNHDGRHRMLHGLVLVLQLCKMKGKKCLDTVC